MILSVAAAARQLGDLSPALAAALVLSAHRHRRLLPHWLRAVDAVASQMLRQPSSASTLLEQTHMVQLRLSFVALPSAQGAWKHLARVLPLEVNRWSQRRRHCKGEVAASWRDTSALPVAGLALRAAPGLTLLAPAPTVPAYSGRCCPNSERVKPKGLHWRHSSLESAGRLAGCLAVVARVAAWVSRVGARCRLSPTLHPKEKRWAQMVWASGSPPAAQCWRMELHQTMYQAYPNSGPWQNHSPRS